MLDVEDIKVGANGVSVITQAASTVPLPMLIDRAATALANAKSAAEVLEARDIASIAYDSAKATARLAKAKKAHDELIAAAYRAQGDALIIESQAKQRLADEYDAAQERGDVARLGTNQSDLGLPEQKTRPATVQEIGLTHKQVHDARLIRDAEITAPGIVRRTVDEAIAKGEEPTKAKVRNAVTTAIKGDEPTKPAAFDRPARARPSEKELRRVFKERPVFREAGDLLRDVWHLAYCLDNEDGLEECVRLTPSVFWEYMRLAGEDLAEHENWLKRAQKVLEAILAAKPVAV